MYILYKCNMLHTIPYNFFFAPRADEKGVFICIYRLKERGELGGERVVLGLCVEGLKEIGRRKGCCTRLYFNTLSCAPEIAREILRMQRGRGSVGNWKEKRLFPAKITLIYPLFVACSPNSR